MQHFFLAAGIIIMSMGVGCLLWPMALTGARLRRPGLLILLAGVLTVLGAAFAPPDSAAAAAVREELMARLDAGAQARGEVAERWAAANAQLPGGSVPARFLRWNTADPLFGTNLNLIPAAAFTEALTPAEIKDRAATMPLPQVSASPTQHAGAILRYSGKVLYVASLPLDSAIAEVLQRANTSFTLVWVQVGSQQLQFMTFDGPPDLQMGENVTVYGHLLGVISLESRTPVLFGKVIER